MVSVLLADDHDATRRGLRHLVEEQPDWKVCAEATTGRQAVELAKQHKPDLAVLDITMLELNGLEATRQIRKALPNTEVLIFTMHESEELVRNVLAAGARCSCRASRRRGGGAWRSTKRRGT
jgi:DNA-binding NarL/FixJ family response regulator